MDPRALRKSRVKFTVHLHPSLANRSLDGVREHLNARLRRWNEDMDAVLLSYTDERIDSHQAVIDPYFPYLRLSVTADVVLFMPEPGYHMCGTVNKIGADYVGMVVLGTFNAAIGRQNIRPDLQYSAAINRWQHKRDARHRIEAGCEIMFRVHRRARKVRQLVKFPRHDQWKIAFKIEYIKIICSVEQDTDHFSMTGSLREPWTGLVMAASVALDPEGAAAASKADAPSILPAPAAGGLERTTLDEPVRKSKKKKRRREEEGTAAEAVSHDSVIWKAQNKFKVEAEEGAVAGTTLHYGVFVQQLGPSKVGEEGPPSSRHKSAGPDSRQLPNGLPNGHLKEEKRERKREKKRRRAEEEAAGKLAGSERQDNAAVIDPVPAEYQAEGGGKVKKKHRHKEERRDRSVKEKT